MGVAASFGMPLGGAISRVETFIDVFIKLYGVVLLAYLLSSWVRLPYSPTVERIQRFLYDVSEPYLRLFRRLLPMAGPLDFSPIIAFVALGVFDQIVVRILNHFQ